jgi:hypothetical protein
MKKFQNSTVAGAFLLATSPAWAQSKTGGLPFPTPGDTGEPQSSSSRNSPTPSFPGGKSQIDISSVTLDKADKNKLQVCTAPKVSMTRPRPRHILSLAFDPKKKQDVTLQFAVDKIPSGNKERVLLLLYSRCLSSKPKIKTPLSKHKLALDVNDLEIVGTYNLAAQPSTPGPAAQQMTVDIILATDSLAQQIEAGNNTFYFQAGVLKKTDFERKNYRTISLSPLTAVHFTSETCPSKDQFSSRIKAENASCQYLSTKTE